MVAGLRLAKDDDRPLSTHLDELTARAGLLLLALTVVSLAWFWRIDETLSWYLVRLSPCVVEQCLSVYAPAEWVALRWLSVFLLALVTIIPFICWQALAFARPGLLPRERFWLSSTILIGGVVGMLVIVVTMLTLLPALMAWGHRSGSAQGVVAAYDAVEMLRLVLAVIAVEAVILLTLMATLIAGVTALLDSSTVNWWRWRLHGISLLLIWLAIPSHLTGVRLVVMLANSALVEASILPFSRNRIGYRSLAQGEGILDGEAGLRRIAVVSCRCAGACDLDGSESLPSCMAAHSAQALCLFPDERDHLIDMAVLNRWTDVIISGCDASPLPEHLVHNMETLGIRLRGLSLLDVAAARANAHLDAIDLRLALASMVDPWPESGVGERVLSVDRDGPLHVADNFPWGLILGPRERYVTLPINAFEGLSQDGLVVHGKAGSGY